MKEDKEVITEFNEYVNVTASELDKWLKSDDSSKAGWHKDGGDGESVGQDSGHKIVEILKSNPNKDPKKYTDDQIQHMRKVASYCKRHLAQESKGLKEKDPEEVKKTKSYISLMNWGHDPLKDLGTGSSSTKKQEAESVEDENENEEEEAEEEEDEDEEEEQQDDGEAESNVHKAGGKRKKSAQSNGANKKRETAKGESSKTDRDGEEEEEDDEGDQDDEEVTKEKSEKKTRKDGPKKGETVSWNWGSGHPQGKVLDVKEGQ